MTYLVSADCETARITNFCKCPPMTCLAWATADGAGLFHVRDRAWVPFVANLLEHGTWTNANLPFDLAVVCREEPELIPLAWQALFEGRCVCTQMNERLIDIANGVKLTQEYNLAAIALRRFGVELDKDPELRRNYGPLRDVPLDQWNERQRQYPIDDARWNLRVHHDQGDGPGPDRFARACTSMALQFSSIWGFRTDLPRVYRLKASYERELAKAIDTLREGIDLPTGREWERLKEDPDLLQIALLEAPLIRPKREKGAMKWTRTPAVARTRLEHILRQQGQEPRMTKGGEDGENPQTSIDEEACRESGDTTLFAYAEYQSIQKRLSYDLKALMAGEVHPGYIALQTNGRTASRGESKKHVLLPGEEPQLLYNAQNMPKKGGERECIVPRPGCKFIILDYPSLEMRTWAQVCLDTVGTSVLADFLNDPDKDPHSYLAAKVAGVTYEAVMANKKQYFEARDNAKRLNYGCMADMGPKRFIATCHKDEIKLAATYQEEMVIAYRFKALWEATWPEARLYFRFIQSLGNPCTITQFVTGRIRGNCSYTDACNGFFSSLANDLAQAALFTIQRECYDPSRNSILFGCRVVLFPHDEFVIEAPDDGYLHDRAMRVKALCDEGARDFLPDIIVSTEPCVANRYSKSAKALYDADKRLVPWDIEEKEAAA